MGYNESQQVTTSTSTYTSLTTSTGVVTLVSTATHVVTTFSVPSIYRQNVTSLQGLFTWRFPDEHLMYVLCSSKEFDFHVDEGQLHISYNVTTDSKIGGGAVDFWLLNDEELHEMAGINASCTMQHRIMGIVHDFRSSGYNSTVDIPSSGTYHIVFINPNTNEATVTLNVDYISPSTAVTMTEVRTEYSTQTSMITTEMMKPVSQPVGLGMPFFSGIGLVAVAVIAIAVAMKRRRGTVPLPPTPVATTPPPPQEPERKYCVNCGASISSHATYCSKCGSKQSPPQVSLSKSASVYCIECGYSNPVTNEHCGKCGKRLDKSG